MPPDIISFLPDLVMLIGAGLLAGVIAGLFGVGGGTITVPILYHWFLHVGLTSDQAMHTAVGTSLATIIATSASSMRAHEKRGSVDHEIVKNWAPYIGFGSAVGVVTAYYMTGKAMVGVFGAFLLCVATYMLCTRETTRLYNGMPQGWARRITVTFIGIVSSLVGIGGGSMAVPVMTLGGVPMQRAVGTSSALGSIVAIPGAICFVVTGFIAHMPLLQSPVFSVGYVSLVSLAVLLPTTALTAPVGARLAHKLDRAMLRRIFSLFLAFISLKMLWSLFHG